VEMSVSYGYYTKGPIEKAAMCTTYWTVSTKFPLLYRYITDDSHFNSSTREYYRKALVEKAVSQGMFLKGPLLEELFEPLEEEVVKLYMDYKNVTGG
jgi:hypothetical protein